MRALFYILAIAAGAFGILGMLRTIEKVMVGEGLDPVQLVIGAAGLILALLWLKRARTAGN
jgi:hypothetical protein